MNAQMNEACCKQSSSHLSPSFKESDQSNHMILFEDYAPYGIFRVPAQGAPVLQFMSSNMIQNLTNHAANSNDWYEMVKNSSYALLSFYEHQRILSVVATDSNPNGCCKPVKMVIQLMDIEGGLHPMLALIERDGYQEEIQRYDYRILFFPADDIVRYEKIKTPTAPASPVAAEPKRNPNALAQIRTFGSFDVFINDQAISFPSAKAKELLALLIDYRGGYLSTSEAISYLWPEEPMDDTLMARYRKVVARLKATLDEHGIGSILISKRSQRRVDLSRIECDLIDFLAGDPRATKSFHGIYMQNYEWSEVTCGALSDMLK